MGGYRALNTLKTALLIAGLWAILLGLGAVIDGGQFMWIFAGIGVIGTVIGYWNSDKMAVRAMGAVPVTEREQPQMYRIVRELSHRAGKPMPRLYVAPTRAPNAFASGRSPKSAVVCCTEGLLELLDERELRGVLGHELMHVYNRDILTSSVAAAAAGLITGVAQFVYFFGGRNSRSVNPIAALAMVILAPLAAGLIQLAVSRTREYDADSSGADLTGDPLALASALRKLQMGVSARPLAPQGNLVNVSHLMIANPFRGAGVQRLFATHPPMEDRIERLENMARGA